MCFNNFVFAIIASFVSCDHITVLYYMSQACHKRTVADPAECLCSMKALSNCLVLKIQLKKCQEVGQVDSSMSVNFWLNDAK